MSSARPKCKCELDDCSGHVRQLFQKSTAGIKRQRASGGWSAVCKQVGKQGEVKVLPVGHVSGTTAASNNELAYVK